MNGEKELRNHYKANVPPCHDCPNRTGTHCDLYNESLGDGEYDIMPCERCDYECGVNRREND